MDIWNQLGIEPTDDERSIKRAYAKRLKIVHPEDDPDGFKRLRQAYETALAVLNSPVYVTIESELESTAKEGADEMSYEVSEGTSQDLTQSSDTPDAQKRVDRYISTNKADQFVVQIAGLLQREGEGAAIDYLDQLLPDLVNLDLKWDFEERLLELLLSVNTLPEKLIEKSAKLFHWQEGGDGAAMFLLQRVAARERVKQMRNPGFFPIFSISRYLDKVLSGPYRLWLFQVLALSKYIVVEMQNRLRDLQWYDREVLEYELNPKVVQWWASCGIVPRVYIVNFIVAVVASPLLAFLLSLIVESVSTVYIEGKNALLTSIGVCLLGIYAAKYLRFRFQGDWAWMLAPYREWRLREGFFLKLLRKPANLYLFNLLAISPWALNRVRNELSRFPISHVEEDCSRYRLDAKSVQWWRSALAGPRLFWTHLVLAFVASVIAVDATLVDFERTHFESFYISLPLIFKVWVFSFFVGVILIYLRFKFDVYESIKQAVIRDFRQLHKFVNQKFSRRLVSYLVFSVFFLAAYQSHGPNFLVYICCGITLYTIMAGPYSLIVSVLLPFVLMGKMGGQIVHGDFLWQFQNELFFLYQAIGILVWICVIEELTRMEVQIGGLSRAELALLVSGFLQVIISIGLLYL